MSGHFDVAVIGAGHNGLTAALMLARRGRKVVVLERREVVGGLAAAEEFAPGYRTAGVLHDTGSVRSWVVDELELAKFGLETRADELPVFIPSVDGTGYLHWRDPRRGSAEIASLSDEDAESYGRYRAFVDRLRPVVRKIFDEPPADLEALGTGDLWALARRAVSLRLLGRRDMMELLRVAPMCVGDWAREWFRSEIVCSALAGETVAHGAIGPWAPTGTLNLLVAETLGGPGYKGGPAALFGALARAAAAAGIEIRTGAEVRAVNLEGGKVTGVTLGDDSVVAADRIAASCDPKTLFLSLVPSRHLDLGFEREVSLYRARGMAAKVDLALSGYPELVCRPGLQAARIRTGERLDDIERAADAVKYRQMSAQPVLDVFVPTLEDPDLAPVGHHVFSVLAYWAPHDLEGGWGSAAKEQLLGRVLETLERHAPAIRDMVVAHRVRSPHDLEAEYGISGGHLFHGEHAPDQLLARPSGACPGYRTPFAGLYLCGSGSHPGGGITCAPGALASRAILE